MKEEFAKQIIRWYLQNKRVLPWRQNREPYRVWLSEIMLQQTRVAAAIPYYERFLAELPTVESLAAASQEQLYKLWEGLGYYSRARNLQKAAQIVVREYGGVFPSSHAEILKLPGIGPYTAGAISSICFDLPVPAVDGNVLRVMARLTGDGRDITHPAVKKEYASLLAGLYPKTGCGDFTQGLMELGATLCLPGGPPNCKECPVKKICKAFEGGTTAEIPVKKSKKPRRRQAIAVLVLVCEGRLAIRKREARGLLAGLWEFPNQVGEQTPEEALSLAASWGVRPGDILATAQKTHIFTHIEWEMCFRLIPCGHRTPEFVWASEEELRDLYAIPSAFQLPDALRAYPSPRT